MKKVLIIAGSLLLALVVAIGGYGYYLYSSVQSTVDSRMHSTLDRDKSEKRPVEVDMEEQEPVSFLLLGLDADESTSGRTDTIMVVTVNPADESMKMVSIPRDTRMKIVGRGIDDKVNHAYAFGGADMAVATVENYLDIPIDYYLRVNMAGFKDIVDAVGGVAVMNDFEFDQSGYTFEEGELFLDGDEALAYARMRQQDPQGDLGRNERQRQIVTGMVREGASLSSITRAGDILDAMGSNMVTNLSFDEMVTLQQNYSDARHNSETLEISGSGDRIDGIWYLIVPEDERQRISSELQAHLQLDGDSVAVNDEDEDEEDEG